MDSGIKLLVLRHIDDATELVNLAHVRRVRYMTRKMKNPPGPDEFIRVEVVRLYWASDAGKNYPPADEYFVTWAQFNTLCERAGITWPTP